MSASALERGRPQRRRRGEAGKHDLDPRASPGSLVSTGAAAMGLGDRADDGESEPGASGDAGSVRFGAVQPFEHTLARRQAGSLARCR